jgi:galactokinase/mevalonate kinase-like predicted kinase
LRYRLSIPARINILGNPSDANEGDFATISAAVDPFAHGIIEPCEDLRLEVLAGEDGYPLASSRFAADPSILPLPYTAETDLLRGAINLLFTYSAEFRSKFLNHSYQGMRGLRIALWTEVPRQSGLGGSSLLVLLTLAGLREYYQLDHILHNDFILAEITQRVEGRELKIACGFADRYVPLFGGIAYIDYRGKLFHQEIREEPLATYERLDPWVDTLPLVAISTGIQHDSGDVHGRMRPRYLDDYRRWYEQGGETPKLVRLMEGAWETAWRGKIALLEADWQTFGSLMNTNHRLVNEMMAECGFADGAGWANNLCIQTALENGALGAKLTGAGGGGSVFALTRPGEEGQLAEILTDFAARSALSNARVFQPQIQRPGLRVRKID